MKIMILSPMLPQPDGGGAIPVLLHAQLVGLRGRHDVTLVAGVGDEPWEAPAVEALTRSGVDLHIGDRRQPSTAIGRWRRRARLALTWGRGAWPWRTIWFAAPSVQDALDQLTRTRSFDVISVEDSSMAVLRLPAAAATVMTEHEVRWPRRVDWQLGPPRSWPSWALRELDWRRWPRYQRECWQRFDRIQVFSERDARAIAAIAPPMTPRVRVNPFGLVPHEACDPANEDPGSVLLVGNFSHYPNRDAAHWLAEEIMPAVRRRHPAAHLRIVGTAPPPEILALANEHIEIVADAEDVRPYLEAACVVVAPVRTGGGMRMKVLHALASGKAVVTTARGAEGYVTSGNALPFVVADDAREIAEAIATLLEDEGGRRRLAEHGRSFAIEHHSVAAWVARLEDVYEDARHS